MATDTNNDAKVAAEAPAKVAETVANTAEKLANESAKTAKRERATAARRAKRQAAAEKTPARRAKAPARKTRATTARNTRTAAARTARNTRTAARNTAAAATQGIETLTNTNFFNGFDAVPAFAPFQNMFAGANDRGQEVAQRGQKVAEELANLARANVEAIVEASRVAAQGARSISQDVIATGRDNVEQTADAVRTLAEAKSPTEYLQLQSEFARASFDRMVAESSRFTEAMVKLAGEAFQPISNRATANAERFNTLVA